MGFFISPVRLTVIEEVEGEVELDRCSQSEAGTIETTLDQHDDDFGDGAGLPRYVYLQEPAPKPGTPGGIAAPTPTPAGAFDYLDRLRQENQRLALGNQLLRENQKLRENQDLLLQENQFLRDRWEPHRARFAVQDGGGAPMMTVAPGVWADPVVAPVVAMAVAPGVWASPTGSCFPEPTQAPRGPRVRNKPPGDPEAPHCQEPSHLVARLVAWSQQRPEQRRSGARAGRGQPSSCA